MGAFLMVFDSDKFAKEAKGSQPGGIASALRKRLHQLSPWPASEHVPPEAPQAGGSLDRLKHASAAGSGESHLSMTQKQSAFTFCFCPLAL